MAELTTEERKKIPAEDFALGKTKGGKGRYPIEDKSHAENALARVSQHGDAEEKAKVREKVHEKYPEMGKDKPKRRHAGAAAPRTHTGNFSSRHHNAIVSH